MTIVYPLKSLTYSAKTLDTKTEEDNHDFPPTPDPPEDIIEKEEEQPVTIVGDDMEISYYGDPHLNAYQYGESIGSIDDMQTGYVSLLEDEGISIVADQQDLNGNGSTYVTSTNMTLGADKVSFFPDGTVTLNGEALKLAEGESITLEDGSIITNIGGSYNVSTNEYNITIENNDDYQDLDCATFAEGVAADGVTPTGLWGDIFSTESLEIAASQDTDGDGYIEDMEGDLYLSGNAFGFGGLTACKEDYSWAKLFEDITFEDEEDEDDYWNYYFA